MYEYIITRLLYLIKVYLRPEETNNSNLRYHNLVRGLSIPPLRERALQKGVGQKRRGGTRPKRSQDSPDSDTQRVLKFGCTPTNGDGA
jgi:hypothetical protein